MSRQTKYFYAQVSRINGSQKVKGINKSIGRLKRESKYHKISERNAWTKRYVMQKI